MSRSNNGYSRLPTSNEHDSPLGPMASASGEPSGPLRAALPLPAALTIGGGRVYLHWSLIVIVALVGFMTWNMARGFPSPVLAWVIPVTVLFFLLSILAHEAAHALAWQKIYKVDVQFIILYGLGGLTVATPVAGLPKSASIVVPLVGPLTNLLLSALLLPWPYTVKISSPALSFLLFFCGWMQLVLGIWNLLPGVPMDGLATLEGAISCCTSAYKSKMISHIAGVLVLVAVGILSAVFLGWYTAIWVALIAAYTLWVVVKVYRAERASRPVSLTNPTY